MQTCVRPVLCTVSVPYLCTVPCAEFDSLRIYSSGPFLSDDVTQNPVALSASHGFEHP